MVLPMCIESSTILAIWLKDVPDYTVIFTILILAISLVEPLKNPIDRANMATGDIKKYQIVEGGFLMIILPLSYLFLKLGGAPYVAFIVQLVVLYIVQIIRLFLVCDKIEMSKKEYFNRVLMPVGMVLILSIAPSLSLYFILPQSLLSAGLVIVFSILCVLVFSYYVGLNKQEKTVIRYKVSELWVKMFGDRN